MNKLYAMHKILSSKINEALTDEKEKFFKFVSVLSFIFF